LFLSRKGFCVVWAVVPIKSSGTVDALDSLVGEGSGGDIDIPDSLLLEEMAIQPEPFTTDG
jgi:hypothetical protein